MEIKKILNRKVIAAVVAAAVGIAAALGYNPLSDEQTQNVINVVMMIVNLVM